MSKTIFINFEGKLSVNVEDLTITNEQGMIEDTSKYNACDLEDLLNTGLLNFSLAEAIDSSQDEEIEIHALEVS